MTNSISSAALRAWADQCEARALSVQNQEDYQRLRRMRDALLDLAREQDWLDGVPLKITEAAE